METTKTIETLQNMIVTPQNVTEYKHDKFIEDCITISDMFDFEDYIIFRELMDTLISSDVKGDTHLYVETVEQMEGMVKNLIKDILS